MNSIKGKIINYNESFFGEIIFNQNINKINKIETFNNDVIIIPGFVDLHCHGGNGFDTMEGYSSIKEMSNFHLLHGTTTLLPTTWTSGFDSILKTLKSIDELINDDNNNIEGIHQIGRAHV